MYYDFLFKNLPLRIFVWIKCWQHEHATTVRTQIEILKRFYFSWLKGDWLEAGNGGIKIEIFFWFCK